MRTEQELEKRLNEETEKANKLYAPEQMTIVDTFEYKKQMAIVDTLLWVLAYYNKSTSKPMR